MDLAAGQVIPGTRYRILSKIGEGGMGSVFAAEHVDLEKKVAVKVLRADVAPDPDTLQQFRQEARAASKIGNLYICDVTDFGDLSDGRVFGAPGVAAFGSRQVAAQGFFMDYDGQPQATPDITTRGIMLLGSRGCVAARYYLDVFPTLVGSGLGPAVSGPRAVPAHACAALHIGTVPELQPGAAAAAGLR